MNPSDFLRNAFSNLRARKLRSFLTIFAVVIGAALISLLVSLAIGTQNFLTAQVRATMPPNIVMVASGPSAFEIGLGGLGFGVKPQEVSQDDGSPFSLKPLTLKNIENIKAIPHVERTDPYIILQAESVRLQDSDKRFRTQLRAMPEYVVQTKDLVAGRYISDLSRGECIIANQYLESFGLKQPQEAIGKQIIIQVRQASSLIGLPSEVREYSFTIAGVTERTLNSTEIIISMADGIDIARFWGNNADLYTDRIPPAILQVKVDDSQYERQVSDNIKDLGLGAITSNDILGLVGTIFTIIEVVLSVFGLIALGVASLGIINTLIMSIHERTREIGIMKAVGASKSTIRQMFTIEGAVIGFVGGIIGVTVSYILGFAINRISHATFLRDFETLNISVIPWWLIMGVIILTTIIALLAALYPSYRASELDPIEALRYE